jgi:hypothetical protein
VFWSKSGRDSRRQKVLDELLELDPADRRQRLELAVAAGDVRSVEVDQALHLVARLDSLRRMTLQPAEVARHRDMARPDESIGGRASSEPSGGVIDGWERVDSYTKRDAPGVEAPRDEPIAVPVVLAEPVAPPVAAPAQDRRAPLQAWVAAEPLPLDAVGSARLISRPRSRRRSNRAQVKASGPGRAAAPASPATPAEPEASATEAAAGLTEASATEAAVVRPVRQPGRSVGSREAGRSGSKRGRDRGRKAQWPDISWLRDS